MNAFQWTKGQNNATNQLLILDNVIENKIANEIRRKDDVYDVVSSSEGRLRGGVFFCWVTSAPLNLPAPPKLDNNQKEDARRRRTLTKKTINISQSSCLHCMRPLYHWSWKDTQAQTWSTEHKHRISVESYERHYKMKLPSKAIRSWGLGGYKSISILSHNVYFVPLSDLYLFLRRPHT